jgi:putative PIN family toxin of toxin-antitoxin system
MQRIVIDTNVFVSALIQKSYPYHIVNHLFLANKVSLCISDSVFEEYCAVLGERSSHDFRIFTKVLKKSSVILSLNPFDTRPLRK